MNVRSFDRSSDVFELVRKRRDGKAEAYAKGLAQELLFFHLFSFLFFFFLSFYLFFFLFSFEKVERTVVFKTQVRANTRSNNSHDTPIIKINPDRSIDRSIDHSLHTGYCETNFLTLVIFFFNYYPLSFYFFPHFFFYFIFFFFSVFFKLCRLFSRAILKGDARARYFGMTFETFRKLRRVVLEYSHFFLLLFFFFK